MPNYGVERDLPNPTTVYSDEGTAVYYYCAHHRDGGCARGFQWPHEYQRHLVIVPTIPETLYCPSARLFRHPGLHEAPPQVRCDAPVRQGHWRASLEGISPKAQCTLIR